VLTAVLDDCFGERPTAYWLERLSGHVPVAPVHTLDQALDNPFLAQTGVLDLIEHPERGRLRVLANPIRLDGERLANRRAPRLGEDSDAILAAAGLEAADIARLRAQGVV
jgi:crotonobetainyl-CoA:carnitine CoA-transferase CaiB-like acyl-CoA transferase